MTDADKKITEIQAQSIVNFLFEKVANYETLGKKDLDKIQKCFNIITDNKLNYGIEKDNADR